MGDLLSFNRLGGRRGMLRGTRATDWYDRGVALEASDPKSVAAMAAYERALAGRPDLGDAHNNLGRILHHNACERGDLAAAESHYRLALCADPSVALYWFNLGVVVEDQGRPAEALGAYERALAIAGGDAVEADVHYNLARLYEVLGRDDKTGMRDELVLRRAIRHLLRYRALARVGSRTR